MPLKIQMPIGHPKYDPASPGAIQHGCTCDRAKNWNGKGDPQPDGTLQFYPAYNCPMHGMEALRRAARESATQH